MIVGYSKFGALFTVMMKMMTTTIDDDGDDDFHVNESRLITTLMLEGFTVLVQLKKGVMGDCIVR
jgi:hypothetical protein